MHQTLFTRIEAQDNHALVTSDNLSVGSSRPCDLATLFRLQFHIVNDRPNRDRLQRHGIARLDVGGSRRNHLVANGQTLRRNDVGQHAIGILDQSDESRTVRVIFQTLDRRRNIQLAALEVDQTIGLLVTAALVTGGDTAGVVAATL